jgi:serine phosphatase RsbU (regulator of sigma subunit)
METFPDKKNIKNIFANPLAENLYHSFNMSVFPAIFPDEQVKEFNDLSKDEKSFWLQYASEIPEKFGKSNMIIRPFTDFCRTCLITDNEIFLFAQRDLDNPHYRNIFQTTNKDRKQLFTELNFLVPAGLRNSGYEVLRYEEVIEINPVMIKKLARAIHSRYIHEIRNQKLKADNHFFYTAGAEWNQYISEFDDLPDEIKYSNADNAAHIPTKLLSIGYKLREVKKGFKPYALRLNEEEIETMARVEHIRWSWEKRLNGWTFGTVKDGNRKTHPSIIPYEQLSESEKDKDRELVKLIPSFLQDIDYEAFPVSPNRIRKLAYAIKPLSSIHKILDETRQLNDQIKSIATLTPPIEEMIRIRNRKIEEAIIEVEDSYNYARHIQETFLPDDLFIRECFTDSFILFKPKDIVSGDFYFFSRQEHLIIFAAVDCTGHGIPGALLSTLGYGILDQAVNEIRFTNPSQILNHLYSKMHRYLRNNDDGTGISDDMDIILCILDTRTNSLLYSGVKNPLYRISNGEMIEYKSHYLDSDECENGECRYVSTEIQLNVSDTIYLCSDGFADQFGGKDHKKYSRKRFRDFLADLHDCSMSEQSDRLYQELEQWREEKNEDQTDDILVIGIRV